MGSSLMVADSGGGWREELPHLIRQSARYLPSRLVPAVMALLAIPLVSRSLSPSAFGSYSLVVVALPYAVVVAGDWLVAGYQRQAQRQATDEDAQALSWVLIVSVTGTLFLSVTVALGGPREIIGVALLLVPSLLVRLQWTQLQMRERASAYTWMQVTYSALKAGAVAGVAVLTSRADYVVLAWVLATWIVVLIGPRLPRPRPPTMTALRTLAAIGIPLVGASLTINIAATADRFIMASLLGRGATGVYALGYIVGESLLAIPVSVVYLAAYAIITRLWDANDMDAAMALLQRLIHFQLIIAIGLAVLVAAVGTQIVSLVGGEAYTAGGAVVGAIAGAQVAAGLPIYLILVATLRRETRRTVWPSITACLFNVVLTVAAVVVAGIEGAALATVATYLLYVTLLHRAVEVPMLARPQMTALLLGTLAPAAVSMGSPYISLAGYCAGATAILLLLGTVRAERRSA